jgi:hypothetical protein
MRIMTQQPGTDRWIAQPNAPHGLVAALREPAPRVLPCNAAPFAESGRC